MNQLTLLTIIVEESLALSIEKEIGLLGAKGYTISNVSGKGLSGVRDNQWDGENVKIESIVSDKTCSAILEHLQKKYFDRYAIIVFYHPVSVVRSNHFIS
jgi:nitrogen regulatory protein P-II 2